MHDKDDAAKLVIPNFQETPRLSVLICTHNRPDGLARLLATLVPQLDALKPREIVVVNDGTDGPAYAAALAPFLDWIRYEVLPHSLGIAGARNRSVELALGEFLVFTDDDCEVPPSWLDWLDSLLRASPELDVVAGAARPLRLEQASFVGHVQAKYDLLPRPHELGGFEQGFVTACLAVRATTLKSVGAFSTDSAHAMAGEDTELSLRLIRNRARTRIDDHWYVEHQLGNSLAAELRRFERYGRANARLAHSLNPPTGLHYLLGLRAWKLPHRFLHHLRSMRKRSGGFPGGPLVRWLSSVSAALVITAYERGAAAVNQELR